MTRKLIIALALATSFVAADGCQEAKTKSKETLSFVRGDADAVVDRTPDQVLDAARAVATELNLITINTSTTRQADTNLEVRTLNVRSTEDKKVTIRVAPEGDKATRLTVNTGLFGDSALRTQVLDKIKTRLGIPATTQPAAK